MAYAIPTFNLLANVFDGFWPVTTPRIVLPCNLRLGRGVMSIYTSNPFNDDVYSAQPQLLVPAGSDIRDASCALLQDYVECPAGTGRFYCVQGVDDVGKGFANEFRIATLGKIFQGCAGTGSFTGLFWPAPIP